MFQHLRRTISRHRADRERDEMKPVIRDNGGSMRPGQDLVIAGYVGRAGARKIAEARENELRQWFSNDYIKQIKEYQEVELTGNLEQWREFGATECEPVGEGGVYAALWNLSGAYEVGIEFQLLQIPVKQSTVEVCERYDVNPYRLYSENCVLLVGDNGGHLVNALEEQKIPAVVIGRVNPGIKREIYHRKPFSSSVEETEEIRGFLDRPKKDELLKVVPDCF